MLQVELLSVRWKIKEIPETQGQVGQGEAAVMKAQKEGDPKRPPPTQLSVTETATKITVAESLEEDKGFLVVELEESISSKRWVEGELWWLEE